MKELNFVIVSCLFLFNSCQSNNESEVKDVPFQMKNMTSKQIGEALRNGYTTAILALGSTEQHGPHMTTSADVIHGEEVVMRVAERIGNSIICPTAQFGFSKNHRDFPGTITLSEETFKSLVSDYCRSLIRQGFKEIIIITSHGGNNRPTREKVESLRNEFVNIRFIVSPSSRESFMRNREKLIDSLSLNIQQAGLHAGGMETSMILSIAPDHVLMEEAEVGFIGDLSSKREMIDREGYKSLIGNGVVGDPSMATSEIGEAYLESWVQLTIHDIESNRQSGIR